MAMMNAANDDPRAFADGTAGRFDSMAYQGGGTSDYKELCGLVRQMAGEMHVNTEIARTGHLQTGAKLDEQTAELKKPTPYQPTRRKVA